LLAKTRLRVVIYHLLLVSDQVSMYSTYQYCLLGCLQCVKCDIQWYLSHAVVLLVGLRSRDSQVVGSSPGWSPPHSGLGQATYTCVPVSPSSIVWYWPKDSDAVQLGR